MRPPAGQVFLPPSCDEQRTTVDLPPGRPPVHTWNSPWQPRSTQTPLLSYPHERPCAQEAPPICRVSCAPRTQPPTGQCRNRPSVDLHRTEVESPVYCCARTLPGASKINAAASRAIIHGIRRIVFLSAVAAWPQSRSVSHSPFGLLNAFFRSFGTTSIRFFARAPSHERPSSIDGKYLASCEVGDRKIDHCVSDILTTSHAMQRHTLDVILVRGLAGELNRSRSDAVHQNFWSKCAGKTFRQHDRTGFRNTIVRIGGPRKNAPQRRQVNNSAASVTSH